MFGPFQDIVLLEMVQHYFDNSWKTAEAHDVSDFPIYFINAAIATNVPTVTTRGLEMRHRVAGFASPILPVGQPGRFDVSPCKFN